MTSEATYTSSVTLSFYATRSGKQGRGAMRNVIMCAPLHLAWAHGQQWACAVQRLDLGLLVHAQDQCSVRRVR